MLSRSEFKKTKDYLINYQDALRVFEQVAERKQAYSHYESATTGLVTGLQNQQISLNGSGIVAGSEKADFNLVRAHQHAKDVFEQYKLNNAGTRDEFVQSLNGAINGLSE